MGLGGRNRDIRVKHLVPQPGDGPKADEVNKVSPKDSPSKTSKKTQQLYGRVRDLNSGLTLLFLLLPLTQTFFF